jgi:DNA primase
MNTSETVAYSKRRALYALNLAKKSKRPNIILCEGNLDVVTLHQAGFDNAVASMGTALTVEQTRLLGRYTKEIVICYDNDNAGKLATERALQILRSSELSVRVLQLPNRIVDGKPVKQDADDFIKYQGRDAFEHLLSGSENGVEYRLAVIAAKYDLSVDAQKVEYTREVSQLLASLDNPVEREVYAHRAAEACGVSAQAILAESRRAFSREQKRDKSRQLRRDLNPAQELQPKERGARYENLRSARAEEGIIRLLVLEGALFLPAPPIAPEEFSSPLLSKVYRTLLQALNEGRSPHLSLLAETLSPEEMGHITGILQQPESPAGREQALRDYINIVKQEAAKRTAGNDIDPLAAAIEKNKEKRQYGGKLNG